MMYLYATLAVLCFICCAGRVHSLYLDHLERKAERDYGIVPSWKWEQR